MQDRWAIFKITNDLTELAHITGGKLNKKRGKRVDRGCDAFSNDENERQSVWDL